LAVTIRFSLAHKQAEQALYNEAVARRQAEAAGVPALA
jgi:hypothetical protein